MLVAMRRDNMPDFAMYWMRSISTSSKYGKFGDWRPNHGRDFNIVAPILDGFASAPYRRKLSGLYP